MSIVKEVDKNNMWNEIWYQALEVITRFFDKGILILSIIGSIFLSAIGFPKQIIFFIVALTLIDIVSKHISIVIVNYGSLSFANYTKAWKEKILTSRQLKNGISVKTIMYASLMYIAHQLGIIEDIMFGKQISYIIYNSIVLVEISSVLENGIVMGGTWLIPIRDFIKNKYKQLFEIKSEEVKEDK